MIAKVSIPSKKRNRITKTELKTPKRNNVSIYGILLTYTTGTITKPESKKAFVSNKSLKPNKVYNQQYAPHHYGTQYYGKQSSVNKQLKKLTSIINLPPPVPNFSNHYNRAMEFPSISPP